jgi:uncharacterized membrane protein YobD (UPF0266 family)
MQPCTELIFIVFESSDLKSCKQVLRIRVREKENVKCNICVFLKALIIFRLLCNRSSEILPEFAT